MTDLSLAIGVVEFNDNASFADPRQLQAIVGCIRRSRGTNPNGVIVLAFAHGWHHNAAWDIEHDTGDVHFKSFRRVMMSLVLREAERGNYARRVIGVYLGWRGKTSQGLLSSLRDHLTFWSRLNTASRIGNGDAMKSTIGALVRMTKGNLPDHSGPPSTLIFAGHSMGALLVETAFLSMLDAEPERLLRTRDDDPSDCATVRMETRTVEFPDLILLLNAATDSRIAERMRDLLQKERLSRQIDCGPLKYAAPLIVSVTSEVDTATRIWFPRGKLGRRTEGHDPQLLTHSFRRQQVGALCPPKSDEHIMVTFNQSWHCLREPVVVAGTLTSMAIDLPQEGQSQNPCHVRYRLVPLKTGPVPPLWNFRVPGDVMGGHSDVFNTRSNLLVMALAQTSGGVLSLANKWPEVFESEVGSCALKG